MKPKKSPLTIFLWVVTVFMALSAIVFFPSVASIIMALFAVIAIPLEPVRQFWASKKLTGPIKGILLAVLFFVSVGLAPKSSTTDDRPDPPTTSQTQQADEDKQTDSQTPEAQTPPADDTTDRQDTKVEETAPSDGADSQQSSIEADDQAGTVDSEEDKQPTADNPSEQDTSPADADQQEEQNPPEDPKEEQKTEVQPSATGTLVGSVDSDKYHYPSCRWAKKILPENEIWFADAAEAEAAGYKPCGVCH